MGNIKNIIVKLLEQSVGNSFPSYPSKGESRNLEGGWGGWGETETCSSRRRKTGEGADNLRGEEF